MTFQSIKLLAETYESVVVVVSLPHLMFLKAAKKRNTIYIDKTRITFRSVPINKYKSHPYNIKIYVRIMYFQSCAFNKSSSQKPSLTRVKAGLKSTVNFVCNKEFSKSKSLTLLANWQTGPIKVTCQQQ